VSSVVRTRSNGGENRRERERGWRVVGKGTGAYYREVLLDGRKNAVEANKRESD
jgi:hypothetical protein